MGLLLLRMVKSGRALIVAVILTLVACPCAGSLGGATNMASSMPTDSKTVRSLDTTETVPNGRVSAGHKEVRYTFYRSMGTRRGYGERRVFGGSRTELSSFPGACVLLDRYWSVRCSGAVVAPRWALTAAHCVSPHIAYIKYNAGRALGVDGDFATVHYLYRHPGYKVVQEDEGRGMDVTLLYHDVGLVRTRKDMQLLTTPQLEPLTAMRLYDPDKLNNEEVEVLGYGKTETSTKGEDLFEVKLRIASCDRNSWVNCMCGIPRTRSKDDARGVCSGDSGGPVLYRGTQVGVTSMGPLECSTEAVPPDGSASVFTSLYNYAGLINATIFDTEVAMRMTQINEASLHRVPIVQLLLAVRYATNYCVLFGFN